MSTPVHSIARFVAVVSLVGSVLFACETNSVSPADDSSSARTNSADTVTTQKDSTCHKGDSTRDHHHSPADSVRHHMDSLHVKPPKDSVAHDSIHIGGITAVTKRK